MAEHHLATVRVPVTCMGGQQHTRTPQAPRGEQVWRVDEPECYRAPERLSEGNRVDEEPPSPAPHALGAGVDAEKSTMPTSSIKPKTATPEVHTTPTMTAALAPRALPLARTGWLA